MHLQPMPQDMTPANDAVAAQHAHSRQGAGMNTLLMWIAIAVGLCGGYPPRPANEQTGET